MAQIALFQGKNTGGLAGLWASDGTVGGTHELTPITGANTSTGLAPTNMGASGKKILFQGKDAGGLEGLWVTDGTAAGTHELTGISGANTNGGLLGQTNFGLMPIVPYMTVLNNHVLFAAEDSTHGNETL